MREWTVGLQDAGFRLDVFLAGCLKGEQSRSQLQKTIREGDVLVNGAPASVHYSTKTGDVITMKVFEIEVSRPLAESVDLDVRYEDDDCLVVYKPAGLVVHPAPGNPSGTLVNALLGHVKNLAEVGSAERPGIVHRLDKDTSGLLVVAKNKQAHANLSKQFKDHTIDRVYYAVVRGIVQHDEGKCEEPVGRAFVNKKKVMVKPTGGKDALTFFKVLKRFNNASFVEVRLQTGRTHQIRVHFQHMGHPVYGDSVYGYPSRLIGRQALHAAVLGFDHPRTGKFIHVKSDMPEDMQKLLKHLETEEA
ncbi:MAG TPA: RluA family pseudouridine synthase [Candidatus Omnitrophica bacterium]|nr:RluA family pseudouridine synthase [Candidatus Omnitrophota bacterium]